MNAAVSMRGQRDFYRSTHGCGKILCCECEYFMTDHGGNASCDKDKRVNCPKNRIGIRDCQTAACKPGAPSREEYESRGE